MDFLTSEVITAVLTPVFAYVAYRFTKQKSRCAICNDYLPVKDIRWVATVTNPDSGKLEQKSVCNPCFQKAVSTDPIDSHKEFCVRCGSLVQEPEECLRKVGEEFHYVCGFCMSIAPSEKIELQELLSPEFLSKRTPFDSFIGLAESYGQPLDTKEDLNTEGFNQFIADRTDYGSFEEILTEVITQKREKMLKEHLGLK